MFKNLDSLVAIKSVEDLKLKPETIKLAEELKLKDQWESQIKILSQVGITENLVDKLDHGIIGIDGEEYPTPSYEEVLKQLDANLDILKPKIEQGFKKMLLIPFASPLNLLIDRYKRSLLKHQQAGTLLSATNEKLELNINEPVYKSDVYERADVDNQLVYEPKELDQDNHQAKTKEECLHSKTSSGWQIVLVENLPNLPAQGQGQTINGRQQLEAGDSPLNYLKKLQTDPQYEHEQGLSPEAWLTYALNHLEQTNQVIDDWRGQGKICYLLGAYFKNISGVPSGYWSRNLQQVYLSYNYAGNRSVNDGLRSLVRVDLKL